MATISIPQGGVDSRLTGRPAEGVAKAQPNPIARPEAEPAGSAPARPDVPAPEGPSAQELQVPTADEMKEMAAEMQEALDAASKEPLTVDFQQDERSAGFVLQIRNQKGDIVRQFPPEKVLNLRSKLDELSGMVVDETT